MKEAVRQLREFHERFGVPVLERPWIPAEDRRSLRAALIAEEASELQDAIETANLIEIADGIADLIYVAIGTALEFGIPLERVWEEVHRTNMQKVGGAIRADGKILKPEGWQAPQIAEILAGETEARS